MSTVVDERKYTAEDLETLPHADRYELRHGTLVERDMGAESDWLAARVLFLIGLFLDTHPLGYLFGSETSYACFPNDPRHAPRPDVSFIRFGRLPNETIPKSHCRIPPDLVVEVVSPNDTAEEVFDKVLDYQSVGVPLVWVVYPGARRVMIHRPPSARQGRVSELTEADTINGEGVLPGFTCPVSEFYRVPRPPANGTV